MYSRIIVIYRFFLAIEPITFCNRLPVSQLSPPYPCFQLQLYLSSAAMVHRRRLRRRHRRHPFATYFMYLYHFISIDFQSSRSCNSSHCKSLHFPWCSDLFGLAPIWSGRLAALCIGCGSADFAAGVAWA